MITNNNQENTEDKWHYIALDLSDQQNVYQHYLTKSHQSIRQMFIVSVAYNHTKQIMHLKTTKDNAINMTFANR